MPVCVCGVIFERLKAVPRQSEPKRGEWSEHSGRVVCDLHKINLRFVILIKPFWPVFIGPCDLSCLEEDGCHTALARTIQCLIY